jgi:hypothetical protein
MDNAKAQRRREEEGKGLVAACRGMGGDARATSKVGQSPPEIE